MATRPTTTAFVERASCSLALIRCALATLPSTMHRSLVVTAKTTARTKKRPRVTSTNVQSVNVKTCGRVR